MSLFNDMVFRRGSDSSSRTYGNGQRSFWSQLSRPGGSNFNFTKGFAPYIKKAGIFGSKSYLRDEVTDKVNRLSENLGMHQSNLGGRALEFMDEQQSTWLDDNTRDVREAFVATKLKASNSLREEASEDLVNMPKRNRVRNTSEARKNFDRRIQGFRSARNKLKAAKEESKRLGTDVQFNETGFEMLDSNIDQFYDQFDAQVTERRAAYTEMYGFGRDYDELGAGFSNIDSIARSGTAESLEFMELHGLTAFSPDDSLIRESMNQSLGNVTELNDTQRSQAISQYGYTSDQLDNFMNWNRVAEDETLNAQYNSIFSAAGQSDIDALVLRDITGSSASDFAFLSTTGMPELDGYMDSVFNTVRDGFAATFSGAYDGANSRAEWEDAARTTFAETWEKETRKTQAIGQKLNAESIADQISNIRDAERIAESTLDAQTSALTNVPGSSKKKVRGVDIQAGRPE
tara:strand:+ start:10158 stop:11537 length:1380 start_codon:yes stop_codon:yes gene_type:complete